ncbi:MAG TPA: phosphate ABC transporter substrate-binding protein PstS [Candidatus Acidoferrales bacterium]|nr:phosphate ABC transporter substrate-binding protein PstS [Candidatus Acidoferrales bacterium]
MKKILTGLLVLGMVFVFAIAIAAQGQLTGAGATFPYPIYSKWFDVYSKMKNVQINYQSVGSGAGIRQVTAGTVDFGASDGPMTDEQIATFEKGRGTAIYHFPTVLGAVVPTYNIPGVNASLKFTQKAIADIYLGKITKWNDGEISKANPGVNLPGDDIVVVHRSDGSGTTYIFTDFLSKVSEEWKSKVGKNTSVNWPVGLGGKGNEGVSGLVQQTPDAIGYVELIYALQTKQPFGDVQNSSGAFVRASLETTTAAAAAAAKDMPADFRVSITNPSGKTAYPICSFTWLLIPGKIADAGKRETLKGFLRWMLAEGQKDTEALYYAPLPKQVVEQELKAISKIQ